MTIGTQRPRHGRPKNAIDMFLSTMDPDSRVLLRELETLKPGTMEEAGVAMADAKLMGRPGDPTLALEAYRLRHLPAAPSTWCPTRR